MTKLWLILGIILLIAAVLIYLDQEIRLNASWRWDQFFHHETFIVLAGAMAVVLLTVAGVEYARNKLGNPKDKRR